MDLNQIRTFVEVVRAGSFAAAARALGLPRSTISARINALEDHLGTRLFKRTTRVVTLTVDGKMLYESTSLSIDALVASEEKIGRGAGRFKRTLRISVPAEYPQQQLALSLLDFIVKHPEINIEAQVTNRVTALVEENIDLALRVGVPDSESIVIRRLGDFSAVLVASPDYLKASSVPLRTETLAEHMLNSYFVEDDPSRESSLTFLTLGGRNARIKTNSLELLRQVCLSGGGIAYLPLPICKNDLAEGKLVTLDIDEPKLAQQHRLYMAFPSHKDILPAVGALAEHFVKTLG
ncbi:LysR family transcriptional regulator [Halomonas sp. SpR8]|uniref:LysR family transcriptional regulator n=1 Tax=Halomonas sp. SpR8 TaxID=3050463 RepID=UPI0027E58FDB|nr:LysR family transcriptional regulator [Halomonas sp. SpR8]MDQ7727899.1 LysR family transcriptional regulator [Halomonas sp. SpR8]